MFLMFVFLIIASQRLLTGLQVEPRDQSFVFNVSDGQLQFYNAREDRSIRKLQVATKNPLHYFRNTLIPDHIVQSVAFSKKGEWLVTVDRSPSEVAATSYDSTTLKFWLYDERQRRYELNTQINDPHTGEITGLAYNPSGDMCVTSSSDGKFKVWVLVERQSDEDDVEAEGDNNAENVRKDNADDKPSEGLTLPPPPAPSAAASSPAETMCWACRSVGFFRDLRATAAAFSTDGSILAVAYEHIITLWNPTTNSLISTLTCAVPQEAITHLAFLHGAVPYLVACSEYRLYVWDLLTCQVAWSHVVPVKLLALDTLSARFAIYAPHRGQVPEKGSIIIWEPSSPKPLLLARSQGGLVKGLCFAPPMSPIASSAPASSVSSVDAPRSGVLPSSGPRSAVAEAESVLVYMDKSNHMICLEHVSTEKKSALLRKKKRSQAAASAPASAIAALQSPAALMKDNFHKQMVRFALYVSHHWYEVHSF
jgi:NET1-associated nuclear protein 1 (U3 small nucleolar RNA-associated protein 17)